MTDQETTSLIQDIITKAQEERAFMFRAIRHWGEFRYFQRYAKSNKLIIKVLKASADNLFREYCREVIAGTSEITKLLAYDQMIGIITFYEEELKTIQSMLDDYDDYLGKGNFIYSFLGGRREV